MNIASPLVNESRRVALLHALDLLDTPSEPQFDAITRLACRLLHVPTALVSLVDNDRQWFKSRVGLDATETPRNVAFCAHAIQSTEAMVIPDARQDPRFADNPLVTGAPHIRAYAGVPLRSKEGLALGTLCVLDSQPRDFNSDDLRNLSDLAGLVQHELRHREAALVAKQARAAGQQAMADNNALFKAIFDQAAVGMAMVGLDGAWLHFNASLCQLLGRTASELQSQTFQDITHPEDLDADLGNVQALLEGRSDQYAMEKRYLRPDGEVVWAKLFVALVRRHGNPDYFVSVIEDITDQKRTQRALDTLRQDLERRVVERTQDLQYSNDLVRAVLQNAPDAFICVDEQGRIREWNRQAEATLGWSREEAMGRTLSTLIIPARFRGAHDTGMATMLRTGEAPVMGQRLELPVLHRNGNEIPCEVTINALPSARDGKLYFAFLHDISTRQRSEQALAASERRLRMIADNLPVLIGYVDKEERYQFCNRTYATWLGVDHIAAIGRPVAEALGEEPYMARHRLIQQALRGEEAEFELEVRHENELRHLKLLYLPDFGERQQVEGMYVLASDITESKLAHRQLVELARTDALTGLPNRRAFEDAIEQAMARAHRAGRPIALAFLDVDHFKQINDSLGHAIGDEVLRIFALRLTASVRVTDTVARLAGDEFVIVLEGLRQAHEADVVARKLIRAVGLPFEVSADAPLSVSTSVGIAYHAQGRMAAHQLIDEADKALYEAKHAGRNTYRIHFTPARA